MDGTLLDTMVMWRDFVSRLIVKYGGVPDRNVDEKVRYYSLRQTAEFLAENYMGCSAEQGERICLEEAMDFYKNKAKLKPGAADFLKSLYECGVKMYIATATYRPLIEAALEREGVLPLFSGIVTCSEVGVGKTRPDVFLKALEALGTPLDETWVFEDAYHAVKTAKAAGFKVHCVFDETEADHVEVLSEISDIYTVDFTKSSPEEHR